MKPANLTSTLLTRKGLASPTLVGGPSRTAVPLPALPALSSSPILPALALPLLRTKDVSPKPPIAAPIASGHDKIESDRFASAPRAAFDRRVHMSLRLDPGRHLRLRLEASRTGRSMQSLLIQALDEFLERDGPGTSDPEIAQDHRNGSPEVGRPDVGSRREPSQTISVEADSGSTRPQ